MGGGVSFMFFDSLIAEMNVYVYELLVLILPAVPSQPRSTWRRSCTARTDSVWPPRNGCCWEEATETRTERNLFPLKISRRVIVRRRPPLSGEAMDRTSWPWTVPRKSRRLSSPRAWRMSFLWVPYMSRYLEVPQTIGSRRDPTRK